MKRLLTSAEMRAMDTEAIEGRGIPGRRLMDAAGRGVVRSMREHYDLGSDQFVLVLCGKGNNGGDGFIAARVLRESGVEVLAALVGALPEELGGDAAWAHEAWANAGGETRVARTEAEWDDVASFLEEADLVIDALLGTGSRGAPRGLIAAAIDGIERYEGPVVAVDIASGLDADTGEAPGPVVSASLTVTMALPKRGHYLHLGRAHTGRLEVVDIGIPAGILEQGTGLRLEVADPEDVIRRLPVRHPQMHKGDRGRLLLVGGSVGMTGAITLAARAAVRAGAGLVTAGVPLSLVDTVEAKLTEAMTLPLPQLEARALSRDAFDAIQLFQPGRLSALAVGPGMGRHPSTQNLARRLVTESELPLVLDADGLHAFDGAADLLRLTIGAPRMVLTPHVGEFLALTGESMESLGEQRFETVARWAARLNTVLVLKGGPTLIAHPSGELVAVNPTGSEALATGGSGDVLTGFIAGFLAQGLDAWDAALIGVFLHGLAADYLVDEWNSPYGLAAGDLIEALPYAIGDLLL